MFGAIARGVAGLVKLVNKFIPSWEWKGGKATAERDQFQKGLNDVERGRKTRGDLDDAERRRLRRKYKRRSSG